MEMSKAYLLTDFNVQRYAEQHGISSGSRWTSDAQNALLDALQDLRGKVGDTVSTVIQRITARVERL
jgi:hypothetical protein